MVFQKNPAHPHHPMSQKSWVCRAVMNHDGPLPWLKGVDMAKKIHLLVATLLLFLALDVCCFCGPSRPHAPERRFTQLAAGLDEPGKFVAQRMPGLTFVAFLVLVSKQVAALKLAGGLLSPLLYATLTGLLVGNTVLLRGDDLRSRIKPGVAFAKAKLLRLGIILYGSKVSVQQILQLGPGSFFSASVMTFSTLMVGAMLGKLLKVDRSVALLVTTGASICGVSAVMAAAPVVEGEGASGSKVSIALATVMVFGIASMFLYPIMWTKMPWASLPAKTMGIYTGATVYEVAGVVAAGNAMSPAVASAALLTKLVRVILLAPFLVILSRMSENTKSSRVQTPWFAFAFFGVCVASSWLKIPDVLAGALSSTSTWCTAMAMVGLGLESDLKSIQQMGWRPMFLAICLFFYLVLGGLTAVSGILRLLPA